MQPVWGMLSDRLGRVLVMRLALLGVLVPGLLSALAPNLVVLVTARAVTVGLFAAAIPASLVYIGDTVPIEKRHKALGNQLGATAMATALATVSAGIAAYFGLWRLAFALPVLAAGVLGLIIATRLPEPEREEGEAGPLTRLGRFVRRPWAIFVVLLALVEGGVILGYFTYLAPALEAVGYGAAVSGAVVGLFGVATMLWTRAANRVAGRAGSGGLILIGGALLATGYGAGAASQSLSGIAFAAVLVGEGFAFMHPALQSWATEVAPEVRATVVSFFAAALFVGGGLTTAAAAPFAETGYPLIFVLASLTAVPLGLIGYFARRRCARG